MEYNIVTSLKIINFIKTYKNFTVSLGYSNYTGKNMEKELNDKDKFSYFYNKKYNTTIFGQGYIGDINFYVDHYIVNDDIAIYFNKDENVFEWDWILSKEKGIEWYLGHLLKKIHEKAEIKSETIETEKPKGDPYKVINNPGQVTFEDIKAYQEAKRLGLL